MAPNKPKQPKKINTALSDKEQQFIDSLGNTTEPETSSQTSTTHHLFVKSGSKYLHHLAYPAQPDKDKWTSDKRLADRFLDNDTTQAHNVAKRKLGHDNYKLVKEPR